MSLCINSRCSQPDHPDNGARLTCAACGSDLLLQGRYRVMRLLSHQSGFGRIYEAYERDHPKILKVLKEAYNHNDKVLELFKREAQVLAHLNHPGVPQVDPDGYFLFFPKDSQEPCHCLIMEKIDGPNLRQWMVQQGNHPVSEEQALLWLTQLTDVLHQVHQHNYFHRDIKPENVMLRPSGQLVLVDFGAAREMTQTYMAQLGDSDITAVSSAGYTPPEQEQGQAVLQSDFYALGRTIIYLLTAKPPNDPDIYDSRTNQFRWRQQAPHISPVLADLIDQLIAPAAANRPQDTTAILAQLAHVEASQSLYSPQGVAGRPLPWPATAADPRWAETLPDSHPSGHGHKPAWWVAGAVALALGVPLVVRSLGNDGSPVMTDSGTPDQQPDIESVQVSSRKTLPGHTADIRTMVLLKDGQTLVTGSADETIRLWDLQTGAELQKLAAHDSSINALVTTLDEQILISAGADRVIKFWFLDDGSLIQQLPEAHDTAINALAISHNGKMLASADADRVIKLWDLKSFELLSTLTANGGTINDLLFTRDDRWLVAGGESLYLWDLETSDPAVELVGHESFINRLAVSDDNLILISASADRTVRLWDINTQQELAVLSGHQSYVNDLRVDGPELWSADQDKTILVWHLHRQVPVRKLNGFDTDIWRFVVQSNGRIVTIGGDKHNISIWVP
jgi:WD40 repeat protein/tRNA A-37 threonylcarbamoyl transferase component Bud32